MPAELGIDAMGYRLSGSNRSDDLFMYLSRQLGAVDGVDPRERYVASFDLSMASNVPAGLVGAGGAPAESVELKVGGVGHEPALLNDPATGHLELNVDKGANGISPPDGDLSIAGNIANGNAPHLGSPYRLIERTHTHPVPIKPRHDGKLWLIVGTDSGFEGVTTLFYAGITVRLTPVVR